MRYFEDFSVGQTFECGSRTVTREEIVSFASQWDPQSIHVDEAAGQASVFGDIIASGIHTLAVCNIRAYHGLFTDVVIVAGRGSDHLRFHNPVYPGDEISVQVDIVGYRPDDGGSDRGLVLFDIQGHNQSGDPVLTFVSQTYVVRESA